MSNDSIFHDDKHTDQHDGLEHLAGMAWPDDEVIVQSRELHHMQSEPRRRDARLAAMDRRDGTVVMGTAPSLNEVDGNETVLNAACQRTRFMRVETYNQMVMSKLGPNPVLEDSDLDGIGDVVRFMAK